MFGTFSKHFLQIQDMELEHQPEEKGMDSLRKSFSGSILNFGGV